jgi:hypothetical protein
MISHLCIDSPYAEIELIDTLITWRFESNHFQVDKIAEAISAINIASVSIKAKDHIKLSNNTKSTPLLLNDVPRFIKQHLDDFSSLSTPIDLAINSFHYQPFAEKKNKQNQSYQGRFSATEQQLTFLLNDYTLEHSGLDKTLLNSTENTAIFAFIVNKKPQGFSAKMNTDLAKVKALLTSHKAMLPAELMVLLSNQKNKDWSVVGQFESKVEWDHEALNMSNMLTNFSFNASPEMTEAGPVKFDANLAWQTTLASESLHIDFSSGSKIALAFNQPALIKSPIMQTMDQQVIDFFNDNVMNTVNVEPIGSLSVNFSKETINSDGLNFNTTNLNEAISLSLKGLRFNYGEASDLDFGLQQANFYFVGQLKLAPLTAITPLPLKINIAGDIEQLSDSWLFNIAPNTSFELAQLTLPVNKATSDAVVANTNVNANINKNVNKKDRPSLKTLLSHWQGNVVLSKNNALGRTYSGNEENARLTFDLQIDNQIKQLNLPPILQAKTLELNSKLSGSFTDIAINANVIVDSVPVASANITGDLLRPYVEVMATDLLITDLLALKIKSPIEMKLIDGTLNYHLSGQVENSDNLMANPMRLAVSIKDLTGDVDGTWLQELNWQEQFVIENSVVKSLSDEVEEKHNLTIAKIEIATPITHLSVKTMISFDHGEVSVKAQNVNGSILGGRFDVAAAQWPFVKERAVKLKLTEIDLEKLLELDQKQGIVVTGRVSGMLPIYYDGEHFLIEDGDLHNVENGLIQVFNNPAVEELKVSSTELKLAFDALENLHYYHLSSVVSMADDGYMQLVSAIKGRNPDLDNDVNLNLNLSYDLLGLLESLNITEHFEKKVIKGLQNN